jgi:hypothetical protein
MRRDFDIFERFPDGSTLWKACVRGRYNAQRKMDELAERSDNQFFMIDIQKSVLLPSPLPSTKSDLNVQVASAR